MGLEPSLASLWIAVPCIQRSEPRSNSPAGRTFPDTSITRTSNR
jgi:hypothetical protein